ncbi:MAG: substrate-binding domain-containing protein [Spirochaetales bacterium]|nr:substrate-binding domain-containing protein [Spirochaetales bacterium]
MKERKAYRLFVLICFFICVLFSSCSKDRTNHISKPSEADNPFNYYRISCIIPHKDDGSYWSVIVQGLEQGGKDFGFDVKISYPSLNYSSAQMIDLIRMAISTKVNAIVVPGSEAKGFQEILQYAVDKGITVVLVDTDMEFFNAPLYIGSDNYHAGVIIGEQLAVLSARNASIGVISGDKKYHNLEQRLEGVAAVCDKYKNMQIKAIEYDHFDYLRVQDSFQRYLKSPEIDTIVCLEGTGGMAIKQIINSKPSIRIIAFDDTPEGLSLISSGFIDGLLVQQKYKMGYKVMEQLDKRNRTGRFTSSKILTDLRFLYANPEK